MLELRDVPLPGTTWLGDDRVRAARLHPLSGWDELAVAERAGDLSSLELGLLLTTRCLVDLLDDGGRPLARPEGASALSAGDREAVLLQLRQLALGDRIALVATCPDLACAEPMDLDVSIQSVLATPTAGARAHVPVRPGLVLRRPTGADQRAVAILALDDPGAAAIALLERCVVSGELHPDDLDAASAVLDQADPQASCELALTCPACGQRFPTRLDAADLLGRELGSVRELDLAVHLLAVHYHWTEEETLALPPARRRRYVELVTDAVSASRGAPW